MMEFCYAYFSEYWLNLTVLEQIRTTWINLYICERNYVIEWKKINRKNENEYIN